MKTAAIVLACLLPSLALADTVTVTDGDTIRIGAVRVRLWGIDAPEARQTCGGLAAGRIATAALVELVAGRTVTCEAVDVARYGRTVATCAVDDADLGAAMVRASWAWDYTRYSAGRYRQHEAEARQQRRGVWAADCMAPWDWRRQ